LFFLLFPRRVKYLSFLRMRNQPDATLENRRSSSFSCEETSFRHYRFRSESLRSAH
jgi:hypothetical protein